MGLSTGAEHLTGGTRSDLELLFLRLCRRHRLPCPEVNRRVDGIEVDFLWRAKRVAVETDGYKFHRGQVSFENDHARDLRLRELGYELIRLSEKQLSGEEERIVELLRRAIAV